MVDIGTIKNIIGSIIKHDAIIMKNIWVNSLTGINPKTATQDSGSHVFASIFAKGETGWYMKWGYTGWIYGSLGWISVSLFYSSIL